MATKLFVHPEGGYLLETSTQNYRFTDAEAIRTTENGEGMEEAYPDTTVQSVIDNCLRSNAGTFEDTLQYGEIGVLNSFIQHLIETAE